MTMSKAGKQSVALLTLVYGMLETMIALKLVDTCLSEAIHSKEVAFECATNFPVGYEDPSFVKGVTHYSRVLAKIIYTSEVQVYTAPVLSMASLQIVTDLQERVTDPIKVGMLQPLFAGVDALYTQIDPLGDNYRNFTVVNTIVTQAYASLGFTPRG
jgi:hypothetical protein